MSITKIPPPLQSLSASGISPGPSPGRKSSRQLLPHTTCPSLKGPQLDTTTARLIIFRAALVRDLCMRATTVPAALDGCVQSCTMALLLSKLSTLPSRRHSMHASSLMSRTVSCGSMSLAKADGPPCTAGLRTRTLPGAAACMLPDATGKPWQRRRARRPTARA